MRRTLGASRGVQEEAQAGGGRPRRLLEVTACWALWIALGEALDLGESGARQETYILLGIPIVLAFQHFVAKRDIRELWLKRAPGVRSKRFLIFAGLALAVYPAVSALEALTEDQGFSFFLSGVAAMAGAVAAAYAFGWFSRETLRFLLLCIATATAWSVGIQLLSDISESLSHPRVFHPEKDLETFITSLLFYVPTVFVLEEVAFRGAFDSHIHHEGESHGVLTATYVSLLWALWHAPLFGWDAAAVYIVSMVPMGIFLSIFWRKSGNLGVSGGAHALSDSVRNAISGVP